jgi:hypothetical protein
MLNTSDKLLKSWIIIKWLDEARWSETSSSSPIPGPVFASLSDSGKILTHWLAYITDQQRSWEDVWFLGGPVFAEICESYNQSTNGQDVINLLKSYTKVNPDVKKKDDVFSSKKQRIQVQLIDYTPRFGSHLVSIARVLRVLVDYDKSLAAFITSNANFVFAGKNINDDSIVARIAFLLYLISYDDIPSGLTSYTKQSEEFIQDMEFNYDYVKNLLVNKENLEDLYQWWLINKRFHKRLWAAFRNYIKPGSRYADIFLKSLNSVGGSAISNFIINNRSEVVSQLELPGDIWNLRFNKFLFGDEIARPADLREYYKKLNSPQNQMRGYYPEQFDVSWDFAPRMCDAAQESLCPFKNGNKLKEYCLCYNGDKPNGRRCSITKILCGYETFCYPDKCPILNNPLLDICAGCNLDIK